MPTRNLGPCACCVSRYPVKVVATYCKVSYFTGEIVDGMMTNVTISKFDALSYSIYYSDGTTTGATYESSNEGGWSDYYPESSDQHWAFDRAEHTATYSLPVSATDASGNVYNAVIALTWDSDDLPRYGSDTMFYDRLTIDNAANETFEFAFEQAEE